MSALGQFYAQLESTENIDCLLNVIRENKGVLQSNKRQISKVVANKISTRSVKHWKWLYLIEMIDKNDVALADKFCSLSPLENSFVIQVDPETKKEIALLQKFPQLSLLQKAEIFQITTITTSLLQVCIDLHTYPLYEIIHFIVGERFATLAEFYIIPIIQRFCNLFRKIMVSVNIISKTTSYISISNHF